MKKQTAVEWLIDKLMKGEFINSTNELIEQAKIMDKEQKINFAESFSIRQNKIGTIGKGSYKKQAEQYYNETYASETNI